MKNVIFGEEGNVELKTPENPGPPTGCPGLKFDFGLNKVNGIMNICFELSNTYPIGPIAVCLNGGTTTASGLTICGPICGSTPAQSCPTVGYQKVSIYVPITVKPHACVGDITTYCCGSAVISSNPNLGLLNDSCTFTISQQLCVEVPVTFSASACAGRPQVTCDETSSENICANCNEPTNSSTEILNNIKSIFNKPNSKSPKITIK